MLDIAYKESFCGLIQRKYREYIRDYSKLHRWVIVFFLFGLFCDACSTIYLMNKYGHNSELHPIFRLAGEWFGPFIGSMVGFVSKAFAGFYIAIFFRRWAVHIYWSAGLISLWAAWYNVWGYRLYEPNLFSLLPEFMLGPTG